MFTKSHLFFHYRLCKELCVNNPILQSFRLLEKQCKHLIPQPTIPLNLGLKLELKLQFEFKLDFIPVQFQYDLIIISSHTQIQMCPLSETQQGFIIFITLCWRAEEAPLLAAGLTLKGCTPFMTKKKQKHWRISSITIWYCV